MTGFPLLSALIFIPALGALGALALRRNADRCRKFALGVTLFELVLAVSLLFGIFRRGAAGDWLMVEDHAWIDRFGIRFSLGLDGLSLFLVLLTAFLGVVCVLVSWREIRERAGLFHFFLLLIESGVLGVFLATDLFLFYLFWELQVIPMFFLIGMWGHEGRVRATVKFVIYSIGGSLLMLAALIVLYVAHGSATGQYTFALSNLAGSLLPPDMELWLFVAFVLAFAVKIPMIPVHAWLPDAHTEAPTAGSVVLAGLLLKTGAYALLRFAIPLFPSAAERSAPVLAVLAAGGLFYAAWIAFAQRDVKRLVAYSSIAHMGLIVAGFAVWNVMTISGAVLQMVNHGITTSALFIMVGMLYERVESREFAAYGGLWRRMPVFSGFFLLFCMSSLGLPGLNNFVGEILILVGSFKKWPLLGVAGFAGLVPVLVYTLRLAQDVLFGESRDDARLVDLSLRETVVLVPLALLVVLIGLVPGPLLDLVQGPVHELLAPVARLAGQ